MRSKEFKLSYYHMRVHLLVLMRSIDCLTEFDSLRAKLPKSASWDGLTGMSVSFLVIRISCLFEEFADHFASLSKEQELNKRVKKFIKEIKEIVPDAERYRHEVGAHSLKRRKRDNNKTLFESIYSEGWENVFQNRYHLPSSIHELVTLRKIFHDMLLMLYQSLADIEVEVQLGNFPGTGKIKGFNYGN